MDYLCLLEWDLVYAMAPPHTSCGKMCGQNFCMLHWKKKLQPHKHVQHADVLLIALLLQAVQNL